MELDIQLFGGRGASSKANTSPKKATFTTATRGGNGRIDIEVEGVSFKHKGIEIGVFKADQEAIRKNNPDYATGRGSSKYVAVVITDNETNGASIATGKTRKATIESAKEIVDKRKKDILKAIGRNR